MLTAFGLAPSDVEAVVRREEGGVDAEDVRRGGGGGERGKSEWRVRGTEWARGRTARGESHREREREASSHGEDVACGG